MKYLIQKQLSKSQIHRSEVAKLYRELTDQNSINAVVEFLKNGAYLSVDAFDQLLYHCMEVLLPLYEQFLLREPLGDIVRENCHSLMSELYNTSALIIQNAARRKLAWLFCIKKRRRMEEEKKKFQRKTK